jgi:hypothetical protein
MATLALRAGVAEAHIKRPVSFYCHFLRIARFDRIEVRVNIVQRGRCSESLRVSLVQEQLLCVTSSARLTPRNRRPSPITDTLATRNRARMHRGCRA